MGANARPSSSYTPPHHCAPPFKCGTPGPWSTLVGGTLLSPMLPVSQGVYLDICTKYEVARRKINRIHSEEWRRLTVKIISLRTPTDTGFISFRAVMAHGKPGWGWRGARYLVCLASCCSSAKGSWTSCAVPTTCSSSSFTQKAGVTCKKTGCLDEDMNTPLRSVVS